MNSGFEKCKKFISAYLLVIILFISFSPIFANEAEAQWVVWDPGNFVPNTAAAVNTGITATTYTSKEFGLDAVAWMIANLIINRISASTVNWINSGFKGSPAFITNPAAYFQELGDGIAGQFIFKNPNLNFLCGPISGRIKIALSSNYRGNDIRWQCTLSDVSGNMEDFINDFDKGGWDKFFRLTQDSQNNPIGAYIQAEGELARQIAKKTDETNKELSWGKGFFSTKKCTLYGPDIFDEVTGETLKGECVREGIETPGDVVSTQLNNVLGIGGQKLAVADEFNEIVSALLNQLISKAFSGLASLTRPDPTNNNSQTFTDLLNSSASESTVDYFGKPQNTELMDTILNSIQPPTGEVPANPVYPDGSNTGVFIRTSCDPAVETCESATVSGSRSR